MTDGRTDDRVRVHYGMSGSVPLRLFEFVFEPRGCYVLDCGSFTPLFDLSRGRHTRRAAWLDGVYRDHGLDGLLACADSVMWLAWRGVDRVVLHDGGRFARPKLALETVDGASPRAARLHGVDIDALSASLERFEPHVHVERVGGSGLF